MPYVPVIYRLKLYALFIKWRKCICPLKTVICYIELEVPFKACLTVYTLLINEESETAVYRQ